MRVFAVAALLTVSAACRSSNRQLITRDQLGNEWPFVVASGILYCERNGNHVVFESGGIHYAINRSARAVAGQNGYVPVEPILKQLPQPPVNGRLDRVPEPVRRDVFREAARCDGAGTFGAAPCRANILTRTDITPAELQQIVEEGIAVAWPPMPPRLADVSPILTRGVALCER
jgi:hypothetical protein